MSKKTEFRKLAAIMFTDLEGYTAIFQKNESLALEQIHLHRQHLADITHKHQCQIMQFYGDGCLVMNESIIDAVRCAIEIQLVSIAKGIPVRVGIHIGEVIYDGANLFGDAVNVASRIQSAGVPGSIVVSDKVADDLKNHPELNVQRLGEYSLKNLREKLELFAITGSGLVIPPRQMASHKKPALALYGLMTLCAIGIFVFVRNPSFLNSKYSALREERILIPPFVDLTFKPEFSRIGELASSIITHDLNETTEADVVSLSTALLYSNADISAMLTNPALARQTGAANMVKGSYSLTGINQDSLMFWATIHNTRADEELLITIPKKYCSASDPMDCIREMSNAIKGFWKSKGEHLFVVTNNDAYIAYLNAVKLWAHPDPEQNEKAKNFLLQSINLDTQFIDAYFLLLDYFGNEDQFQNEADTIELIRSRFTDLLPRKENYLRYYEAEISGRYDQAFKHFWVEYQNDPKDLLLNTKGMVLALESLNDPQTAIEFENVIPTDSMDLQRCTYCRTRANMALQAYIQVNDTLHAGKLAAHLEPHAEKSAQNIALIYYYMLVGDTNGVNRVIHRVAKRSKPESDDEQFASLMAGRYALINNNSNLAHYYFDKAIQLYRDTTTRTLGRCHYLRGNLSEAENIFNHELKSKPNNKSLLTDLATVYARQQKDAEANEIIDQLEKLKSKYDFGLTTYFQGRIKAVMGDHDAALKYLETALDEGVNFRMGTTFQHDPDLLSLRDHTGYQELTTRYRRI